MRRTDSNTTIHRAFIVCVAIATLSLCAFENNVTTNVDSLIKLHTDGNYKEAFDGLREYVSWLQHNTY